MMNNVFESNPCGVPLLFVEQNDAAVFKLLKKPWKVLIIDDDVDVHLVTKLVLKEVEYDGAKLSLLHAYSASEAKDYLSDNLDIAVALVDVVMETDDAGLKLVNWIRNTLDNQQIRLILRTGQPGMAPEEKVIINYDINDYKSKSELSSLKLKTSIISALRAFQDLELVVSAQSGIEMMMDASDEQSDEDIISKFSAGLMHQVMAILAMSKTHDSLFIDSGFIVDSQDFTILNGQGIYAHRQGDCLSDSEIKMLLRYLSYSSTMMNIKDNHPDKMDHVFVHPIFNTLRSLYFFVRSKSSISQAKKNKLSNVLNKSSKRLSQMIQTEGVNVIDHSDFLELDLDLEKIGLLMLHRVTSMEALLSWATEEFYNKVRLMILTGFLFEPVESKFYEAQFHQSGANNLMQYENELNSISQHYGLNKLSEGQLTESFSSDDFISQMMAILAGINFLQQVSDTPLALVVDWIEQHTPKSFNPIIQDIFIESLP